MIFAAAGSERAARRAGDGVFHTFGLKFAGAATPQAPSGGHFLGVRGVNCPAFAPLSNSAHAIARTVNRINSLVQSHHSPQQTISCTFPCALDQICGDSATSPFKGDTRIALKLYPSFIFAYSRPRKGREWPIHGLEVAGQSLPGGQALYEERPGNRNDGHLSLTAEPEIKSLPFVDLPTLL